MAKAFSRQSLGYDSEADIKYTDRGHIAGSYGMHLADISYHRKPVDSSNRDSEGNVHNISSVIDVVKICRDLEEESRSKRRKWFPPRPCIS